MLSVLSSELDGSVLFVTVAEGSLLEGVVPFESALELSVPEEALFASALLFVEVSASLLAFSLEGAFSLPAAESLEAASSAYAVSGDAAKVLNAIAGVLVSTRQHVRSPAIPAFIFSFNDIVLPLFYFVTYTFFCGNLKKRTDKVVPEAFLN